MKDSVALDHLIRGVVLFIVDLTVRTTYQETDRIIRFAFDEYKEQVEKELLEEIRSEFKSYGMTAAEDMIRFRLAGQEELEGEIKKETHETT